MAQNATLRSIGVHNPNKTMVTPIWRTQNVHVSRDPKPTQMMEPLYLFKTHTYDRL